MANNPYINKIVKEGTTLIDLSTDTALAADVATGKYFHLATGERVQGTASAGGGAVIQDQNGYLVLSDQGGGSSVTVEALNVTQNGTYTASSGYAYSPVTVNVGGVIPPTPPEPPEPWERPSDWPDLSKMNVSGDDILYMTYYADENRGFCDFSITCTGDYTVEIGHISGTTFVTESSQSYTSGDNCTLYFGTANGTYKVFRVTGTAITSFNVNNGYALTIDDFCGFSSSQGILDVVGKLSSCTYVSFNSLYNLVNVNISGVNLANSASGIFTNCSSLISIDVSDWDTSNVTSMNSMFSGCRSLTYLDVSDWDTSNVTSMSAMFSSCSSLISLDVSDWDTSNVTSMNSMFSNCASLTYLDVSGFNTANVTSSMGSMFNGCCSLTYLDVSNFDTSKATGSMGNMFNNCSSLVSLDVSGFNTAKATNMASMFYGCSCLTSLDVSGFDTANVTSMATMFSGCTSITSLDVSGFNTANVTDISSMFNNCYSIASLDLGDWNTAKVMTMASTFANCYSLTSLDVSGFDTSNVTNMGSMFGSCQSLTSLDVSGFNTAKVTGMSSMFYNCYSLTSLDVSGFDMSKVTNVSSTGSMFRNCYSLKGSLILPSSMKAIGTYCFSDLRSIEEWHFLSTTPPSLSNSNAFNNMTDFGGKKIYVPSASLSAYQAASNWSTHASYMVGE